MTHRWHRTALLFALLAPLPAATQDGSSVPPLALSGQYRLTRVDVGNAAATMDFTASLMNPGAQPIEGTVVLRDPAVAGRVFGDFGKQTIPSGGRVRVSAVVSVPIDIYESWSTGDAPAIFVNIGDDRGNVALHRVSLSRLADGP